MKNCIVGDVDLSYSDGYIKFIHSNNYCIISQRKICICLSDPIIRRDNWTVHTASAHCSQRNIWSGLSKVHSLSKYELPHHMVSYNALLTYLMRSRVGQILQVVVYTVTLQLYNHIGVASLSSGLTLEVRKSTWSEFISRPKNLRWPTSLLNRKIFN